MTKGAVPVSEPCARRDLVDNADTFFWLWCIPAATILASALLAACCAGGAILGISWTVSLLVMGAACLVNARGCGRMHCYFAGPFFLLMAVVSLLHGLQVLPLGPHGWFYVGAVLLLGGVLLYFVPEWAWGRYRRARTDIKER